MDNTHLSGLGHALAQAVKQAPPMPVDQSAGAKEPTVHAPNVGTALFMAYEQLRIASENLEDHLLFQSAVRRFYKRNLLFHAEKLPTDLGRELVIELTLAGYLRNNSIPESTAKRLNQLIKDEYASYWEMRRPDERLRRDVVRRWVLESLTVKTEQLFHNPYELLAFASFSYQYFAQRINIQDFIVEGEKVAEEDYGTVLYIAVQKSLLRSNDANIRGALHGSQLARGQSAADLVKFNIKYDNLAALKTTARVSQMVGRHGASLRILRSACYDREGKPVQQDLGNKSAMLELFSRTIDEEYGRLRQRLTAGIIKSVAFLVITKALIGLLIEIPYDIYVTGAISVLPLVVNLLFPPLFIAITGLTLRTPGGDNKQAVLNELTGILYEPVAPVSRLRPARRVGRSQIFNILYVLIFLAVFYFVSVGLARLGFNLLQGVIFFVFLSTASFLGYRLTLTVKELELVPSSEGFFRLLRDTLYAPLIFVGRRISYRFARLNIVAQIFDNVIELPLTTVLRLLRQWTAFLRTKTDEIGE